MGAKSRRKGANGEREAAQAWRDAGIDAKRSAPMQAGDPRSMPDVILPTMPWLWLEVKREKKCNLHAALKQATEAAPDGKMPMAFCRSDKEDWVVTMHFEDFVKILRMIPDVSQQMEMFHAQRKDQEAQGDGGGEASPVVHAGLEEE